jgi:hypothetical protein
MASILVDNRRIKGGVVSTPGINTNVYYRRNTDDLFNVVGAYNNQETLYDWALINSKESKYLKSGVIKLRSDKKSITVDFRSPFPSNEYYIFYTPSGNINVYTADKKAARFTINCSYSASEEVSWVAIHKSLAIKTGINNPGTIFSGTRTISENYSGTLEESPGVDYEEVSVKKDEHINLDGWYNNSYVIKPTTDLDGIPQEMNLSDYSVLISSNVNINTYWTEKSSDRVKIFTSFSRSCIIDYLFIKEGINWWDEY